MSTNYLCHVANIIDIQWNRPVGEVRGMGVASLARPP